MKYVKLFNSVASATSDSSLVSPNISYINEGTGKLLMLDSGTDGEELQITGTSISDLAISKKPSGPTYSYVDLGLASGTKWMTCNLGATQPYEYGDYYAWGETEPYYDSISWSGTTPTVVWKSGKSAGYALNNYKYYSGGSFTKYNGTDGLTTLENSDDAIYVATSGQYKLPTRAQVQELVALSSEWTTQGGVYGILFTGNNSNTLFIPASGVFSGDSASSVGEEGCVWSSALFSDDVNFAWLLLFYSEGAYEFYDLFRYCGFALRGVLA